MQKHISFIVCLFIQMIAFAQSGNRGVFNQPIMPGPSGVFVFAYDSSYNHGLPDNNVQFIISREEKKGGGFKKLATVNFPGSGNELEKRMEKGLLQEILKSCRLSSSSDLLAQLKTGNYDTLGFYITRPAVLEALGMLYIDKEVTKPDDNTGYRVEVLRNGTAALLYQVYLRDVVYRPFPVFKKYTRMANDSAAMASWYAVGGQANYVQVFSAVGNMKPTDPNRLMVYTRRDTMFATYATLTRPGEKLSLFIRPTDMAGNLGIASDTVNLLALSMNNAVSISGLSATDTLGGILLQWNKLPASALYTGIQVLKSRAVTEDFIVADTLPATSTSYLDRNLIPGAQYYYIVEPIRYQLSQLGKSSPVIVTASMKNRHGKIMAPQGVNVSYTDDNNIRLAWAPNSELNLFAYYILRGTSRNNLQVISAPVRDTVYIDSLKNLDGGTSYLYAIRALDMETQWSDTSELVSVLPSKARAVTAPSGLAARNTIQGVRLYWDNVARIDPNVMGYMLYRRKKGDEYFTPLSKTLITGTYFTDSTNKQAGDYEYGCTAVDAWNNQSILSTVAEISIGGSSDLYPPADFYIRNLTTGIEISVPPSANANDPKSTYIIYRRVVGAQPEYKRIGETTVSNSVYVDKQVNKEQLYAYSLSIKQDNRESRKSDEKTIRRK